MLAVHGHSGSAELARRTLARWTLAFHGHFRWTLVQDSLSSSSGGSGAESPQGAPRCWREGGGFESRWKQRHVVQGLHGYVDGTVVTMATSAAVQLEALLDGCSVLTFAAGLAGCLLSGLVGAGAFVKEVIQELTVAIGEPPRRPFEENDAGTRLFWAMDIVVVFFVLATCLFALGFAMMPQECDAGKEPASGLFEVLGPEDEQDETVLPFSDGTRMLIALTLPVLSGGVISIKHSLVSAFLCGL